MEESARTKKENICVRRSGNWEWKEMSDSGKKQGAGSRDPLPHTMAPEARHLS